MFKLHKKILLFIEASLKYEGISKKEEYYNIGFQYLWLVISKWEVFFLILNCKRFSFTIINNADEFGDLFYHNIYKNI